MERLQTEIYEHDTDVDITHKLNSIELHNWIDHLEYIRREVDSFLALCGEGFKERTEGDKVFKEFQKKEAENDELIALLNNYLHARSEIAECEDTQCDMVYVRKHEAFRRNYLDHLEKYRGLKDEFFTSVRGKLALSKRSS